LNIEKAVRAALKTELATVEVIVLDDHSTDQTAVIVQKIAEEDARVRLVAAPELPPGWCGKQHACACLADQARYDLLLFLDADVTMAPQGPARLAAFLKQSGAGLVSAFPRQETKTWLEKLLIPLIEYVLLAYLPIALSRRSKQISLGAGCGQVFLASKAAYEASGGHGAIKTSLHDGVQLPRAFRQAGFHTDLCAGDPFFTCRMYRSAREVWNGLLKNAHEGIAHPRLIVLFTILLIGANLAPLVIFGLSSAFLTAFWAAGIRDSPMWMINLGAWLAILPRTLNAIRFNQSILGVLLHPVAVGLFLIIQWQAFFRQLFGIKSVWKGRSSP
jgi:glycosyltransferase involved in cell wall biosynthesis